MKNTSSSVCFEHEQYEALRKTYRKWWDGELDRPIVPIITTGHTAGQRHSDNPTLSFGTSWDTSIRPDQFIDAHDAILSQMRWHGEAYPLFSTMTFGPGTMAAFLGCTPVSLSDTVWFKPPQEDIPIEELHFEYDANNPHLRRVLDLYEAAMEKWHGSVVVGMVDLGGVLDVLQSFRGVENLLMDLYDQPDEVLRCINELSELWMFYFRKINEILQPEAEGYSDWWGMYGEKPGYILQSDFSYMIGPDQFNTFVAPQLAATSAQLTHAIYHMDGIGEIPHLDSLLAIDGIHGIQWVPGEGTPSQQNWDELIIKILDSGKKLFNVCQKPDGTPIDICKNPGQLYYGPSYFPVSDLEAAKRYADLYGIDIRL